LKGKWQIDLYCSSYGCFNVLMIITAVDIQCVFSVGFILYCDYERVYKLLSKGGHFVMAGHFVSRVTDKQCWVKSKT